MPASWIGVPSTVCSVPVDGRALPVAQLDRLALRDPDLRAALHELRCERLMPGAVRAAHHHARQHATRDLRLRLHRADEQLRDDPYRQRHCRRRIGRTPGDRRLFPGHAPHERLQLVGPVRKAPVVRDRRGRDARSASKVVCSGCQPLPVWISICTPSTPDSCRRPAPRPASGCSGSRGRNFPGRGWCYRAGSPTPAAPTSSRVVPRPARQSPRQAAAR